MKAAIPILVVESIETCLAFWVERLGFVVSTRVPHGELLGFVILQHGDVTVELQSHASVAADVPLLATAAGIATVYIPVDDIAPIDQLLEGYEHIVDKRDTWYGMREIIVRDPAGHFVFFAQRLPSGEAPAT